MGAGPGAGASGGGDEGGVIERHHGVGGAGRDEEAEGVHRQAHRRSCRRRRPAPPTQRPAPRCGGSGPRRAPRAGAPRGRRRARAAPPPPLPCVRPPIRVLDPSRLCPIRVPGTLGPPSGPGSDGPRSHVGRGGGGSGGQGSRG